MAQDKKDAISARAASMRDIEGINSPSDYLNFFRRARKEVADSLSETEMKEYQEQAEVESRGRKAPPTLAAVFECVLSVLFNHLLSFFSRQPTIANTLSSVIQGHLGWEAGQLGDAVCFFAIAYRTSDQDIKTQL